VAKLSLRGLTKRLGGKIVIDNLNMEVESGEMVCLLGPSGSGKTTTLRMIGGFIAVDEGRILVDGADIARLPPEQRPTAMVFQQYALWPHMDVFHNVSFGLSIRKYPKAIIAEKVNDVLAMVGLSNYGKSFPGHLSGGQQQRVALARALVLEPKLLLLDEPLSNLDAQLRVKVREDIREIQQRAGITSVFVTHDQDEALSIADRVAVLSAGQIEHFDSPQNLYQRPRTKFVASFIGTMNLFAGRAVAGGVYLHPLSSDQSDVFVPCLNGNYQHHDQVELAIRPEDVRLSLEHQDDQPTAVVLRRVPRGHYDEVILSTAFGELRAFVASSFSVGTQVQYAFERVLLYRDSIVMEEIS